MTIIFKSKYVLWGDNKIFTALKLMHIFIKHLVYLIIMRYHYTVERV